VASEEINVHPWTSTEDIPQVPSSLRECACTGAFLCKRWEMAPAAKPEPLLAGSPLKDAKCRNKY